MLRNKSINVFIEKDEYYICFDPNDNPFLIDKNDYENVKEHCWVKAPNGYITSTINKKKVLPHRLIMKANDRKMDEDHINHNATDNRKCNLRICTRSENLANSKLRGYNISRYKGVTNIDNYWIAYGTCNYKSYYIGKFSTLEEAIKSRRKWELKYQKEFAYDKRKDVVNGTK